jgi:hypothetical protein
MYCSWNTCEKQIRINSYWLISLTNAFYMLGLYPIHHIIICYSSICNMNLVGDHYYVSLDRFLAGGFVSASTSSTFCLASSTACSLVFWLSSQNTLPWIHHSTHVSNASRSSFVYSTSLLQNSFISAAISLFKLNKVRCVSSAE